MALTRFPPAARTWAKPRGMFRWILFLVVAACAAGYATRPIPRAVVTPARKDVTSSVSHEGVIHSGRAFGVGAALDGTVAQVAVRPGQVVRPGDVLFALDPTPLRDQIRALEQAIRESESQQRGLQTHESAPEFLQAVHDMENARRHLAALDRQGRTTDEDRWAYDLVVERFRAEQETLRERQAELATGMRDDRRALAALYRQGAQLKHVSPVAGVVAEVQIQPGQSVTTGTRLIRIEDPNRVTVRLLIEEAKGDRVRAGQSAWIQVQDHGFPALVKEVTAGVDEELWQDHVTLAPAGAPCGFRDGQPVSVRIVTRRYRHALVLPHGAVHDWRTGAVVYVANQGRVEERAVEAVEVDTGEMAILSGVEPTDAVVRDPHAVRVGQRIIAQRS